MVFLGNHPLTNLCAPANGDTTDTRLHLGYPDLHQQDWRTAEIDPGGIEFNLVVSRWLSLFRETGFEVDDYIELLAPDSATGQQFYVTADWAKQWPSEQVWKLRKRG